MKEEKKIGFYKAGKEERMIGINYVEEMSTEDLRKKMLDTISSESEYKQIIVFGGVGDDHWSCMLLRRFVSIEKIKTAIRNYLRICFRYKEESYWIMQVEEDEDVVNKIKESTKIIDFEKGESKND